MQKIGLLTLYHKSLNCGGNLQAFALPFVLGKIGIDSEQISYDYQKTVSINKKNRKKRTTKAFFKKVILTLYSKAKKNKIRKIIGDRKESFFAFQNYVPHSQTIFDDNNIISSNSMYSSFLVGSDQVWNLSFFHEPFFLTFVSEDKKMSSYAASISMRSLSKQQESFFKKTLERFDNVSVREEKSRDLISSLTNKQISVVLDPTLLVDKDGWDSILSLNKISIDEEQEYIFCYFMGDSFSGRRAAREFARRKKLRIINIPLANGDLVFGDLYYGVDGVESFSPLHFIEYIRKAKYIFTDSFHAVVFSIIYRKNFFVFDRQKDDGMNSRINELCSMFGLKQQHCNQNRMCRMDYLVSHSDFLYKNNYPLFEDAKEKSIAFLKNTIN